KVVMLRIWKAVVNVIARREGNRKIDGVIEGLVCWTARCRKRKWETLGLRSSIGTGAKRFIEQHGAWRNPVEAERGISDFVEKIQVLDRGVVNAVRGADAALSRAAENLARQSIREPR